jgi:hypothetical protein
MNATKFVKKEVDVLRKLKKAVRGSIPLRLKFPELAVVLGISKYRVEVPGIDVETSWKSMFKVIDQIKGLCNAEEFVDRLDDIAFSDMDWRLLISSKKDLISAYNFTVATSGRD